MKLPLYYDSNFRRLNSLQRRLSIELSRQVKTRLKYQLYVRLTSRLDLQLDSDSRGLSATIIAFHHKHACN